MTLSSKDQFDGLMKLKKEIELIQFLKELDNQFKNLNNQFKKSVYEESELTDEYKPEEITEKDDEASVTIPVYIESYILTVLNLGDSVSITDILTASSDEFSLEIDKVRAWLKDDKHQRDLLHVYFGGAYTVEETPKYTVEETPKEEPKYSVKIFSKDQETKVVVKDISTNKFKVADEGIYYHIEETPWFKNEFTAEELTDLDLGQLLGED